ncbi:MAG: hypothetical protein JETT_2506 [Candidatus Jettenia ecosi]|uniref:Uncharacterized protein n=1 Tax=Candidatus Jettenia ecosi TaxID=2494326 RepID=A0A533Q952_9BACT|nr:MAG: hypothetical protein JETT_2506 [Candidatus Jettenia ecosi]
MKNAENGTNIMKMNYLYRKFDKEEAVYEIDNFKDVSNML